MFEKSVERKYRLRTRNCMVKHGTDINEDFLFALLGHLEEKVVTKNRSDCTLESNGTTTER